MRDLALAGILVPLLAMAVVRPFVGVLVWFWIAFMSPHREVYGFAFSQPWAVLAFFATVFGCFVAREPKKLTLNAVVVGLLLFAVVITVSSAVAIVPAASVWPKWERTIKTIIGLLLAFISLVVGLSVARQRNEIAVLRSRGATAIQIVGIAALEAGLLAGMR